MSIFADFSCDEGVLGEKNEELQKEEKETHDEEMMEDLIVTKQPNQVVSGQCSLWVKGIFKRFKPGFVLSQNINTGVVKISEKSSGKEITSMDLKHLVAGTIKEDFIFLRFSGHRKEKIKGCDLNKTLGNILEWASYLQQEKISLFSALPTKEEEEAFESMFESAVESPAIESKGFYRTRAGVWEAVWFRVTSDSLFFLNDATMETFAYVELSNIHGAKVRGFERGRVVVLIELALGEKKVIAFATKEKAHQWVSILDPSGAMRKMTHLLAPGEEHSDTLFEESSLNVSVDDLDNAETMEIEIEFPEAGDLREINEEEMMQLEQYEEEQEVFIKNPTKRLYSVLGRYDGSDSVSLSSVQLYDTDHVAESEIVGVLKEILAPKTTCKINAQDIEKRISVVPLASWKTSQIQSVIETAISQHIQEDQGFESGQLAVAKTRCAIRLKKGLEFVLRSSVMVDEKKLNSIIMLEEEKHASPAAAAKQKERKSLQEVSYDSSESISFAPTDIAPSAPAPPRPFKKKSEMLSVSSPSVRLSAPTTVAPQPPSPRGSNVSSRGSNFSNTRGSNVSNGSPRGSNVSNISPRSPRRTNVTEVSTERTLRSPKSSPRSSNVTEITGSGGTKSPTGSPRGTEQEKVTFKDGADSEPKKGTTMSRMALFRANSGLKSPSISDKRKN